jgi:hypothetical protein
MGKLLLIAVLAALGALAYNQRPEIQRYLKMKSM